MGVMQNDGVDTGIFPGNGLCKPLLGAATPDIFRANPFRITGLPVDATPRGVKKRADALEVLAAFGGDGSVDKHPFALSPPPSSGQIREAIRRLRDPEERIIEEFFWFWPYQYGNSSADPALEALTRGDQEAALSLWTADETNSVHGVVAMHNIAVLWHLVALEWEDHLNKGEVDDDRKRKIERYWRDALKRWDILLDDDLFWQRVSQRGKELDSARLDDQFLRGLRKTSPIAINLINAKLAIHYAECDRIPLATLHIQLIREHQRTPEAFRQVGALVLEAPIGRLRQQLKDCAESVKKDPRSGLASACKLLENASLPLNLIEMFLGKESDPHKELSNEIARICNLLQVAYHEVSDDAASCYDVLERILPMATSPELRRQLTDNREVVSGLLDGGKLKSIFAVLLRIGESKDSPKDKLLAFETSAIPALKTASTKVEPNSKALIDLFDTAATVLRGISLDAWNEHHDRTTACKANDLALQFARGKEAQDRIREDNATLKGFFNTIGDAAGEFQYIKRGRYNAMTYVGLAFVGEVILLGIVFSGLLEKVPALNGNVELIICGAAGAFFAWLVFRDRWKCNEAFSSRFCSGVSNTSLIYVPAIALAYANWRGIQKLIRSNHEIAFRRLLLGVLCILVLFGTVALVTENNSPSLSEAPRDAQATPPLPPQMTPSGNSEAPTTYSVPDWRSSELDRDKAAIDLAKVKEGELENELEKLGTEVDADNQDVTAAKDKSDFLDKQLGELATEIKQDRTTLDESNQYEVDAYNQKVDRCNALRSSARNQQSTVNQLVDAYNAKVDRYNALHEKAKSQKQTVDQMVDAYNNKLRTYNQ